MRKKKLLFTLATVALLLIVACVITAASTEPVGEQPMNLKVHERSLLLEDAVYLRYYVPVEGTNGADVKMLFWLEPQSEYVEGTQDYTISPNPGTAMRGTVECYVFDFRKIAAKQMTVDVYAKVYATDGENEYYSKLNKYSVLQYCYYMLGKTSTYEPDADFEELLNSLLTYGASAQKYFGENTDRLATDSYYQIKVKGTTLPDGSTSGLYESGEQIAVTAPATNEAGEDFLYWQNSAGAQVGTELDYTITVGTQNETYTVVYGTKGHVATDASYFTFTELDDGSYSIAAKDVNNMPAEVVIPATYNGKAVTEIGTNAFYNCANLTEITVPDSVTSIGDWAFLRCEELTNVIFGNNITSIGFRAFQECKSLISISLPNSVTSIGSYAFEYCSNLTSITLGSNVTSIGEEAFYDCTKLKSVYIADLKAWCMIAFGNSRSNPLYYGANLYLNDTLVSEVNIPYDITSIGSYLFYGCKSLTKITIPASVISIGSFAFTDCSNLMEVTIGNNVTSIGYYAFHNCTNLTSITIPVSITSISMEAFENCNSLNNIYYTGTAEEWTAITIGSWNDPLTSATIYYYSETQPTDTTNKYWHYVDSVPTVWEPLVATDESYFTFTELDDGTYSIAAADVNNMPAEVVIPATYNGKAVTSIGSDAFYNCKSLTGIIIPDSVASIGERAFCGCTGLTDITIPDSVTSIGGSAFFLCTSLTNITISDAVTEIRNYAFYQCTGLTNVTLGDSVTSIGNFAFDYCTGLTSISIGDSVTSIGGYAFHSCIGLTNIIIPDSVTSIFDSAFSKCTGLTSIIIPDSVTAIGYEAFRDCTSLKTVYYTGTAAEWESVEIATDNDPLTTATIYHYSETQPTTEGNYWRYVDGVPTAW
ncbi:MAG: leucine-rich repeat domain-containing protein [Clostridia bacterium]|nr:leucine-rich repeat domain-containing protein [Clostridia bacterium]